MRIARFQPQMGKLVPVPVVRCRLDGRDEDVSRTLRYIALAEFELWRFLMEERHHRQVTVEHVSLWVPEDAAYWSSIRDPDECEPVLRVQFEAPGLMGWPVPVERFIPAETYPQAQEAMLAHFTARYRSVTALPGYFVPHLARRSAAAS